MQRNPERLAWTVTLAGFVIFCILLVTLPLSARWYLTNATRAFEARVTCLEGTTVVENPEHAEAIPVVKGESISVPEGTVVSVDETAQAVITFFDQSLVRLFPQSSVMLMQMRAPRFGISPRSSRITLQGRGGILLFLALLNPSQITSYDQAHEKGRKCGDPFCPSLGWARRDRRVFHLLAIRRHGHLRGLQLPVCHLSLPDTGQRIGHFSHGAGPHVRIVSEHHLDQDFSLTWQVQLFHLCKEVGAFQIGGEKFNKNLAQGPDIAPEIEGTLVDDIGMAKQESLQHGARAIQLGVKESEKLVIDLDLQPFTVAVGRNNIIEDKMGEVLSKIREKMDSQNLVLFDALLNESNPVEMINTFLPVLFLMSQGKLIAWQNEFFGEIFIQLLENAEAK